MPSRRKGWAKVWTLKTRHPHPSGGFLNVRLAPPMIKKWPARPPNTRNLDRVTAPLVAFEGPRVWRRWPFFAGPLRPQKTLNDSEGQAVAARASLSAQLSGPVALRVAYKQLLHV